MTLALLAAVAAVAALLWVAGRRRTSRASFAASAVLFFAIGGGPVPAWLLRHLQAPYAARPAIEWGERNAIVMLGLGTEKIAATGAVEPGTFSYSRVVEAASLYHGCRKARANAGCKIVVSGGDARRNGVPEATVYRDALIGLGIDAADVLSEPRSMNTWQNAQFTRIVLAGYRADRVLLVTSGVHLRRSVLYFAHFGVAAIPVRAEYLQAMLFPLPLAYNFSVADLALHECLGIARYRLYDALGWNPARTQPGDA
ncbi:YdcF family protein [Burkholderia oklahomensis]|uniref:YdcF family protein n=1 Tax=Burkholderia oklahomensis TaxID=342113 RepID=UPI002654A5E7|nr:YdcF family protein [Burkholderia oklahomensis]MDN7672523.1 YdcF family protein [Burkholderia oklahomensis]